MDFAYILNTRTRLATESNNGGLFSLTVQLGDTLRFRLLGYRDTSFVVDKIASGIRQFNVQSQAYALNTVEIRCFHSYAAFKTAFLNLKLDDKDKPRRFNVNIDPRELAVYSKMGPGGAAVSIPMSGIGISAATRDERRAKELLATETYMERYNRLVSHENIGSFTRLQGATLDSFMVFIRTRATISPKWDEYQMMVAVKLAFTDYLAIHPQPNDSTLQ